MGDWVLASVFLNCLLLSSTQNTIEKVVVHQTEPRLVRQIDGYQLGSSSHSAVPDSNLAVSSSNYQPYNLEPGHALIPYEQPLNNYQEFRSLESTNEKEYLDTSGYEHYKTATSFNLEGPKQLETITTNSYHKEVEPYDIGSFQKAEEEHAEVHYHQHKHLHKHNHKQEHVHKHQQQHKHEHGHGHQHESHHAHHHDSHHQHQHNSEHKHSHKNDHYHKHHQEHNHNHYASHKHKHNHKQEHHHEAHHGHKHSHYNEHKHSHHNEHKHDHHHSHKHHNEHKHNHDHHENHKHHHQNKEHHKHHHKGHHHHKYVSYKH